MFSTLALKEHKRHTHENVLSMEWRTWGLDVTLMNYLISHVLTAQQGEAMDNWQSCSSYGSESISHAGAFLAHLLFVAVVEEAEEAFVEEAGWPIFA